MYGGLGWKHCLVCRVFCASSVVLSAAYVVAAFALVLVLTSVLVLVFVFVFALVLVRVPLLMSLVGFLSVYTVKCRA